MDISILLGESVGEIDVRIEPDQLKLHCVPVINLFRQQTDPIRITHTSIEYPVVPDVRAQRMFEVYSIVDVSSSRLTNTSLRRGPEGRMEGSDRCFTRKVSVA